MAGVKRALRRPRVMRGTSAALSEELSARGWSPRKLAVQMDCSLAQVQALLDGALVTRATAAALGRALGTSAELWLEFDLEARENEIRKYGRPGFW